MKGIRNFNELPSRYADEIVRAARRAYRMAGAKLPLRYIGMGMTGIVFCDARDHAFKVARKPGAPIQRKLIAEEAEWLRVAGTVPTVRRHVARLIRFHRMAGVIERECVGAQDRPSWKTPSRWDLHQAIGAAMKPYGYGAPEYKEDSYVYTRGRGWVLVDASMPIMMGSRLVARAAQVLAGKRFLNESPHDLAFAVRMESGRSIDPARAARLSERLEALPKKAGYARRRDVSRRDPSSLSEEAREEDERLRDFAQAALEHAKRVPVDSPFRFGRYKLYLTDLGLSPSVKSLLWRAHQRGYLRLARADLTPAMDRRLVEKSEIKVGPDGRAVFHFLDTEGFRTSRDHARRRIVRRRRYH